MLGYILFFIMGAALSAVVLFPVLRSRGKRMRELEKKAGEHEKEASEFRDKITTLTATVTESAGAVSVAEQNKRTALRDQAHSFEKIESTVNESARIAAEIAEKTGSVATIASRMEQDVVRGFEVLEKNVRKMEDIKDKNSGIINGIISLGNKVNKIRDIVRVINTITDQTKVIAFNAALEAASAGETGKRFAVVAAEVNRLADDIAGLTRQIREQVEEIRSSSSSLIVYSEEGSDRIAEGYKLIKDMEDIFREIRSGAEITSNQARNITVSTGKQLKSSEQIYTAIAEVSQRTKTG
jgi:methyl-accepting chemotaxis protein